MFDEQKLVNAIRNIVSSLTKNGARMQYQEGYVVDASSYLVTAYLNGDETNVTTDIIPLTGAYVTAGDYIQAMTSADSGWRWVSRVKETALYSKVAVDYNRGRLLFGDGNAQLQNAGSYGQVLFSGGTGSAYWGSKGTLDHGTLTGLGDDDHTQYQLRTERNVTNGYPGLDSSTLVLSAYLGTGGAGAGAKYLADDRTWKTFPTIPTVPAFSGVRVIRNNVQSISDSTSTVITWATADTTEHFDTDSYHSLSTNTTRFTAPSPGYYHCDGCMEWASNNTGSRQLWFRVSDVSASSFQDGARDREFGLATAVAYQSISDTYYLDTGDYVELWVFQNSSVSLNTGSGYTVSFSMYQIH